MFKTLCYSAFLLVLLLGVGMAQAESAMPALDGSKQPAVNNSARPEAVIFSKKSSSLTLKKAYSLQKAFVRNSVAKGVDIVGYKAGVTSPEAMKAMDLNEPVSGVLLVAPLTGKNAEISLAGTENLKLEMEVAYLISKPINQHLAADLMEEYVAAIAPAIEIPLINFPTNDFNGLDVIANNALAYKLVIGEWRSEWSFKALDSITATLGCDGKTLADGKGSNALGSQKEALLWLVNHLIDQGYKIQKNQILITGTMINMTPAKECVYTADYASLGKLQLKVTP